MNNRFQRISFTRRFGPSRTLLALGVLLFWTLAGSLPASAQAVYGSIFGTVTDNTGAVVPNATVTVIDISKGISVAVKTNESGFYRVQHLIPDAYRIETEAAGFSKALVDNVLVFADTAPEVDVKLAVGSVSNTVTVTDETPLLETDRAEVSTILDARAVDNLPNMNRNFTEFELLTPGTTYIGWGPGEGGGNPQRSGSIEVDGQLPFATGYELDGTDNQEPINGVAVINPNLDAVSEMKVTAQNYDAEFGKAVAGLVTAQTKSGSNQFHGTAFEYRRSDAQQARDPFANSTGNETLPPTLHNQFGGSVGGPVKRDRLFFFADYQGLREKTGTSTLTTVPTLEAETTCTNGSAYCDLSDYTANGLVAYMPLSPTDTTPDGRSPFLHNGLQNQIPSADLSPAAVAFFKLLPAPNTGALAGSPNFLDNNYSARGSGIFNTNQPDVRVDYKWGDNLHLFGRYTFFGGNLSGAPYFGAAGGPGFGAGGFAGTDAFHYSSVASGGDYVVSPKWLTDFRFGYYNIYNNTQGPDPTQALGNNLGIPDANLTPLSVYGGMPQFNITIPGNGTNGGTNIEYGTSAAQNLQQTSQYQFVNNWSHEAGNHNFKLGIDFRYGKNSSLSESGSGNVNWNGTYFANQSRTAGPDGGTGLGFATFLLGDVSTYWRSVSATGGAGETTQKRLFAYAQDQWRMTSKISVNYGMRWELYTPEAVTGKGQGGMLNLDTGNIDIAGYGNINNQMNVKNNRTEFAPRLGITYQIFPKTVIRAGYGIVYGQGWAGNTFGEVLTGSYPLQVQQDLVPASTAYGSIFNFAQGPPGYTFPAIPSNGEWQLPDGISQTTRPNQIRLPTVGGWNLTIERELTPTLSLQVGYIGSEAYHNMFDSSNQFNANEGTLAGFGQINPLTNATYTLCEREPYCGNLAIQGDNAQDLFNLWGRSYGWSQGISDNFNEATGSYNALQIVVNKRVSKGLSFLSHYTWSHAIDHESYEFMIDSKIGKGNSYYNRRQAFVFAGNYDLPFGKGKQFAAGIPGWANEVIGGFQLNGTLTMDGGIPFSPCYNSSEVSQDNDIAANDGCGPSWPDKVAGQSPNIHKGSFDPSSLSVSYLPASPNPLTPYGTAGSSWGDYARPKPGVWANWGRDQLWGPGLVDVDASLQKNFDLPENVKMQMIVQAFNVFNHVNYGGVNSCIDCGAGSGLITSTLSEQYGTSLRFLQFAARFSF